MSFLRHSSCRRNSFRILVLAALVFLPLIAPAATLSLSFCCGYEGSSANATVSISGGALASPLTVNLVSGNPATAAVPQSVTIPAGANSTAFTINAADNNLRDGTRAVTISASASGHVGTNMTFYVYDNDPADYTFTGLSELIDVDNPVQLWVRPRDISGSYIDSAPTTLNLLVVLPDGSTKPLTPATVSYAGSGWSGSVTLPAGLSGAALRLRVIDGGGITSDSQPFDIQRVLALTTADLKWDAQRGRIYASVPASAGGPYANQVVAIDPVALTITGSAATGGNPNQLGLTSGGEMLYAALDESGRIARIDPVSMTVLSSFPVNTTQTSDVIFAGDIVPVAGEPDLLVVSRKTRYSYNGVVVFDHGVMRPVKTPDYDSITRIEPSADPTIFFGYNDQNTGFEFRRLKLDGNGISELSPADRTLLNGFYVDIVSEGDRVYSTTGAAIDGVNLKLLGNLGTTGPVRPDAATNRVYYVEARNAFNEYDTLGAYDPGSLSLVRRLSVPLVTWAQTLIRWGTTGLAFRTPSSVVLVNSKQLVPSDPPAELMVTVQTSSDTVFLPNNLVYSVQLTNQGPNIAHDAQLSATLSTAQTLSSALSTKGTASISGSLVTLKAGDLEPGATVLLTITTKPQSAGSLSCSVTANSTSLETNFSDNRATKTVFAAFQTALDKVNQLRLPANNLIADDARNLLWATLPSSAPAPLSKCLVAIDPLTGLISAPLLLNGNPQSNCIALSGNGRYLYAAFSDLAELQRFDLSVVPISSIRIPLEAGTVTDLEVMEGDGSSVLLAMQGKAAVVYDGATARTFRGSYNPDRIERTSNPNVFVAHDGCSDLTRLTVAASGVSTTQRISNAFITCSPDIRGAGNLLLSSDGLLFSTDTLSLKSNLGVAGPPCLDLLYGRAYIVYGNTLQAFDSANGSAVGSLTLSTSSNVSPLIATRWSADGFAVLGASGVIYIARSSAAVPPLADRDGDRILDAWEAANFGMLNFSAAADNDGDGLTNGFEFLFASSPLQANGSALQTKITWQNGNAFIHLLYPRRQQRLPGSYSYEVSADLTRWSVATNVTEAVLSTSTVAGVVVEQIDAAIPFPSEKIGAARLRWNAP